MRFAKETRMFSQWKGPKGREVTRIRLSRSIGWRDEEDDKLEQNREVERIGGGAAVSMERPTSVPSFRGRLTSARRFQRKFN